MIDFTTCTTGQYIVLTSLTSDEHLYGKIVKVYDDDFEIKFYRAHQNMNYTSIRGWDVEVLDVDEVQFNLMFSGEL